MYEYQVQDMTCQKCVQKITQALEALDPDLELDVDLPAKLLRIESQASGEDLANSIQGAGYTPVLMPVH